MVAMRDGVRLETARDEIVRLTSGIASQHQREMGTWSGAVCTAVFSNEAGTLASVLNGTTQSAASLCVQIHDPNGILVNKTVTYTVKVTHPG